MKVTYHKAIISFCPDLTSPDALSLPLACLLVGEDGDGKRFAASAVLVPGSSLALDPLSRDLLSDVPHLLKRHVGAVLNHLPRDAALEQILLSLHDALRNSLHVAGIASPSEIDVAADELQPRLIGIALRELRSEIAAVQERLRFATVGTPDELSDESPDLSIGGDEETLSWPLRADDPPHAAHA